MSLSRRALLSGIGMSAVLGATGTGTAATAANAATSANAATGPSRGPSGKGKTMKITKLASGLLFPEGPTVLPDGDVLVVEIHRGTLTRVKPDGTTSVAAHVGGGPNGSALGPDGRVYIANCGGLRRFEVGGFVFAGGIPDDYTSGSIQAVDLSDGSVETLYTEADGLQLRGPNDLVLDAHGGIYFTDYGKSDGVTGDKGRLYYGKADGSSIKMIAGGMEGPNGIGLSPDGTRLYVCVASMIHAGISVIAASGDLVRFVDINVDDDPGITNITWGGPGMRTAYVTASSTGHLLKIENWPYPGLKLNYAG
jgi:gluconolactonase